MPTIDPITMVLVDLTEVPPTGHATKLVRMRGDDSNLIDIASKIMGLNQAEYMRVALINTSKKVIHEKTRDTK